MASYIPGSGARWALSLVVGIALVGCQASLVAYDAKDAPGDDDEPSTDGPDTTDGDDDDVVGDDDDDDGPPVDPIEIDLDGVTPWFGTTDHEVRITGGPFAADTVVTFGGVAAVIVELDDDELTVEVPAITGVDGIVDIAASSSEGASPAPLDFRYFEDGRGKIGALGQVSWYEHRGGYWDASVVDFGTAEVLLSLPTERSWEETAYAGAPDTCEREWTVAPTYVYDPEVPNVVLRSGGNQLVLPGLPQAPFVFYGSNVPVQPGNTYDLQPITANPNWPDFGVQDLAGIVPNTMNVTTPNLDGANFAPVGNGFTLGWNGPYVGDAVLVLMQRMQYDGTNWLPQEVVTCWLSDDGTHIVPPNSFDAWNPGADYAYIRIGRAMKPQNVILPHNDARSEVVGVYWTVGYLAAD